MLDEQLHRRQLLHIFCFVSASMIRFHQVTQLVFALVAPGNMISNLMAAAISGAGASQAGDMMQVCVRVAFHRISS